MPYACARAICLTFCYNIRWALTPIFGPSFVKECLRPDHSGFARFKIDTEVIRCATLEAEGWKNSDSSRTATSMITGTTQQIPRSAPVDTAANNPLPPWERRPNFMIGSPFDSGQGHPQRHNYTYLPPPFESPELSPRSQRQLLEVVPAWTSINRTHHDGPPPPPQNTSLASSLLTEPRYSPTMSWRAADSANGSGTQDVRQGPPMPHRQSVTSLPKEMVGGADPSPGESNPQASSSDEDTPIASSRAMKKRKRSVTGKDSEKASKTKKKPSSNGPTKFTAADARAAHWLLNLSVRDSQLAASSSTVFSRKHGKSAE